MSKKIIYGMICYGITALLGFNTLAHAKSCSSYQLSCIHHKDCAKLHSAEGIQACTQIIDAQKKENKKENELDYKEACTAGCHASKKAQPHFCHGECLRRE